jgi:hypothetical protein
VCSTFDDDYDEDDTTTTVTITYPPVQQHIPVQKDSYAAVNPQALQFDPAPLMPLMLVLMLLGIPILLLAFTKNAPADNDPPVGSFAASPPRNPPRALPASPPPAHPGRPGSNMGGDRIANHSPQSVATLRRLERERDGQIEAIQSSTLDPITKDYMISDIRAEFDATMAAELRSGRF